MAELAELKPTIYMQFDGFEERTHLEIRGRDLRRAKQRALDNCAEFGLGVSLVAAVSGASTGRWTVAAAVDEGVPAHVLTAALYERFGSRGEADFADRALSATRKVFGGHVEQPTAGL